MMIVWLYEAIGTVRSYRGVTDDEQRARRAAAAPLRAGDATTARVEQALTEVDAATLISGYVRTGAGWRACRGGNGAVRWLPLR